MSLSDDLEAKIQEIIKHSWDTRKGRVVPDTSSLAFKSTAVSLERATVLYADLRGSTQLVQNKKWWYAAEVYKAFLYCSARMIRSKGGTITSYDGDRIMAIFVGDSQTSDAARAALKINYAVTKLINPAFEKRYTDHTEITHGVGIDTSPLRVVKTGVRDDHDLVWIGRAANFAAKLSEAKGDASTWVSKEAYGRIQKAVKFTDDGEAMWKSYTWTEFDDRQIYGSTWHWGGA